MPIPSAREIGETIFFPISDSRWLTAPAASSSVFHIKCSVAFSERKQVNGGD